MKFRIFALQFQVVLAVCFVFSLSSLAQTQQYNVDSNILEQPASFKVRSISSVATDKDDNIYIFHRGNKRWDRKYPESTELIKEPAILKYSKAGKLIDSFGANMFLMPHMITIDHNGNIWAVDVWLQQVVKLDRQGKPLLTLGEIFKPGMDSLHFDLPTDIAVLADNSFFVGDGYGNARICRFSKTGKWTDSWGKHGTKPGEFNIPHSITIHGKKLFVADRENSRLQVFDLKGNFLSEWNGSAITGKLFALAIDNKENVYVTETSGTFMLSKELQVLQSWPEKGHDIAVDSKGTVYLSGSGGIRRISKEGR